MKRKTFKLALFLVFFAVFGAKVIWADEDEETVEFGAVEYEPIEVKLEVNPVNPTVNNPWSVFVLVNHPRPDEVSVDSIDFPSSLALERIRTDTRTVSSGTGAQTERWTRVEFLFIPRRAETISLEPFEVRINERYALTEAINASVQGETAIYYEPRLRWVTPPAGLRLGEVGEVTLELSNWDPARRTPDDFFSGKAPHNAILDVNPPVRAGAGYRYAILLIPLEGSGVRLEAFTFIADTYTLSVPSISLPILPARPQPAAASAPETSETQLGDAGLDGATAYLPMALPFPLEREEVFFLWRGEYDKAITAVEALWGGCRWAEALAEIRRNERDRPFGPSLVSLRRSMEEALGFHATEDERRRPLAFPLFAAVAVCLVLVLAVTLFAGLRLRRRESANFRHDAAMLSENAPYRRPDIFSELQEENVTSRRRYGFILIIVFAFILGLVFILPDVNLGIFPAANSVRSGKIAILRMTQIFRVPDYKGAVDGWFSEGQPVILGDSRGEWCFAETLDGRSGWVERKSVIYY